MRKPENTFIAGVHKYLPATLHREKQHNAYRGGTADVWYSGNARDLWVEYKFLPRVPKPTSIVPIGLSALQDQWIRRRQAEGRNVWVIVGCSQGGYILRNLDAPPTAADFLDGLRSRQELAETLTMFVNGDCE